MYLEAVQLRPLVDSSPRGFFISRNDLPKLRIFSGGKLEGKLIIGTTTKNVPEGFIKVQIADGRKPDGTFMSRRTVTIDENDYRGLVKPL